MPKSSKTQKPQLPSWTIEHAGNAPMSRREKVAVVLFFFVMLMALSFLIASITGYVEMRGVFA
ncbi:hypothetical protein N5D77_05945 [Comamonas thiooxydans]|uniref:Uncharacterized protein n=1 Tax=Comamonas thiooxydans TaxID=363952 RepID=A0AA42TRB3_9BURK|nr:MULTISPECIES: hypothetical protein [Comamonas]MDH1333241.1 hypothetical protein [Comamonas thiooxydans]MDH1738986.1 hypothetical protein [Comamonas thiooxydans]MDH1786111.1 hypothetical protein [Comamonas thiooxydans]MPS95001.1 hypothetical protein [Comamonas sp.]